jgi:hypothetical protein
MALVLRALLEFLRIIRIARDCIICFPDRGASLLALLGRKLKAWCQRIWLGDFRRPKPAEGRFLGSKASSYSVSGGSAFVREYVVAASSVPVSASHPSPHERQPGKTVGVHPPVLASNAVDHPHSTPNPIHPFGGGSFVDRSSDSNLSAVGIQRRASDRYSIITNLRESIRAPLGQSSRLPRATHHQFVRDPDPARSRERPTRPSTPTAQSYAPIDPTHRSVEIIMALHPTQGDGEANPVFQPLASSSLTHDPLNPPPKSEIHMSQSSTSVAVAVPYPLTESLPLSSNYLPQITDRPFSIDYPTDHSSPDPPAVDLHGEPPLGSPTSSNHPTFDYFLPEGRLVQLINSDQIPRYAKNATMQVGYTNLSSTLTSLCRPRVETAYYVGPLTTEFP